MRGTVLTLGGGGFSTEERVTPLDELALWLTGVTGRLPRVCFVPTASGDALSYGERFEKAFAGVAQTTVLSLFCRDPWGYTDPAVLLEQDLVYVGGGSTANLLAVWRLHGLPPLLERAAADGTVLAGISAGMNCWYEGSSTDSFGPLAALPDGLGFLPGSACPHYFGEADRQAAYHRMVGSGALPDGHAADDGVALLWRDGELAEAVTERPGGQAFRVSRVSPRDDETGDDGTGSRVVETPLPVRSLI